MKKEEKKDRIYEKDNGFVDKEEGFLSKNLGTVILFLIFICFIFTISYAIIIVNGS
jgi:hypothetical protein